MTCAVHIGSLHRLAPGGEERWPHERVLPEQISARKFRPEVLGKETQATGEQTHFGGEELGEPRAPHFLGSFYLFYKYGAFCKRNTDPI